MACVAANAVGARVKTEIASSIQICSCLLLIPLSTQAAYLCCTVCRMLIPRPLGSPFHDPPFPKPQIAPRTLRLFVSTPFLRRYADEPISFRWRPRFCDCRRTLRTLRHWGLEHGLTTRLWDPPPCGWPPVTHTRRRHVHSLGPAFCELPRG